MNDRHELCSFRVGELLLGIEVTKVQEVIQFQTMTRVPLAPKYVRGLINLRGQIITAIDLRQCFGFQAFKNNEEPMNIIVHDDGHLVSLLVDSIGDVFEVHERDFETAPGTVPAEYRETIVGAYKQPDQLLLVLNPEKAIELAGGAEAA